MCWRDAAFAAAVASVACFSGAGTALAQNYGIGSQGWDQQLSSTSLIFTPTNPIEERSREYTGLPVAGWLAYASVLTGVVWDDNVFQAHDHETKSWGARLNPSLDLIYNNGIHKTRLYGFADARIYGEDNDDANVVNGGAGASHIWEAQRDLVFKGDVDFERRTDINNAGVLQTSTGPVTLVDPLEYNQLSTSVSAQKSSGFMFFGLGAGASYTNYNDVTDSLGQTINQDGRDETVYKLSGRVGAWLSPVFYGFIDPSQNWRHFRDDGLNSEGQRIVAGIGTDRLSLFRGEIFAGYQRQDYDNPAIATIEGDVFGGRLSWYPTRDLMFTLNVDKTLGDSSLPTPGNVEGSPVEATSVLLEGDYLLSDVWSLSARFGYSFNDYKTTIREDNQWVAGSKISYYIWRNLATTFEWQYVNLDSNVEPNSFDRNIFTLGATYKY